MQEQGGRKGPDADGGSSVNEGMTDRIHLDRARVRDALNLKVREDMLEAEHGQVMAALNESNERTCSRVRFLGTSSRVIWSLLALA